MIPCRIVITGASSGIGSALAAHYARRGACLGLLGRDEKRLRQVAANCRQQGAETRIGLIDITDREGMLGWLQAFDEEWPVDLLVANAGVMAGRSADSLLEDSEASYRLAEINVLGLLNSIHPLLPRMIARRSGQIAIMSSIAAFIPLPDAPTYGASKAAALSYGLALRSLVDRLGIKVSVVCPGYVRTPMMDQESGPKPFAIEPGKAARLIAHGLERNKPAITFPILFSWMTRIGGLLPDRLRRWTQNPYRFTVAERRAED